MAADFVQDDLFAVPQELPQGLRYEPGFLTPAEQDALIAQIETLPLREAKFREYFARRRVAHFHDGPAATSLTTTAPPTAWTTGRCRLGSPPFAIASPRISACPHPAIVHALVSEYRPGTPIGWHRDKPVYGMVAGISLAGTGRMRFRPYDAQDAEHTHTLDLAPGSLYVMRDAIRWRWQHSLLPVKALRYSITLRTRATAAEQARW